MNRQGEINEKMRAVLVDWIVDVEDKLAFSPETLFLTVNILDRFLSKKEVKIADLQLAGTTAMLIASKYEEVAVPPINDFVRVADNCFSHSDVVGMEQCILQALDYTVTTQTPHAFLMQLLPQLAKSLTRPTAELSHIATLAEYALHLQLLDYAFLQFSPSVLAAGSLWLALREEGQGWEQRCEEFGAEKAVRDCGERLWAQIKETKPVNTVHAVHKKFAKEMYMNVVKISRCSCCDTQEYKI